MTADDSSPRSSEPPRAAAGSKRRLDGGVSMGCVPGAREKKNRRGASSPATIPAAARGGSDYERHKTPAPMYADLRMSITKTHIIQEIKRTASANGGVPLGFRQFATETGIRESDWKGKLWARWNDAVLEAGFTPNELTGAYDESELLHKYATLALKLGNLPTMADMRLSVSQGFAFPNWDTFIRRFGDKKQLVNKLREYCRDRPDYAPVISLCENFRPPPNQNPDAFGTLEGQIGYVYLIKHGARREYKIGRTNNTLRREGEIAIELPEKAKPVHVIQTDDPAGIEAYWHKRFESKRMNGEWFELNASDLAAFKRRKFM
jgi:hypothetical protein